MIELDEEQTILTQDDSLVEEDESKKDSEPQQDITLKRTTDPDECCD